MIRSLNIWLAAWVVLAAGLLSQSSAAAQDTKRVAVLEFTGPSAGAVQAQITQGLKARDEVELVSAREVKSTADRLNNSLESATEFKEVGEALEVSAFVEGEVAKKGRNLQATVRVRDASTGEVVHEETWSRRRSGLKTIKPTVWAALGPAISESSAPVPKPKPVAKTSKTKPKPVVAPVEDEEASESEEEEEEEQPRASRKKRAREEDEEDEEDDKPKRRSVPGNMSALHPALVVSFGPRIQWRTLSWDGDTNFNSYSSTDQGTPSFNLALSAQYYPGAHSSSDWYSDLGLDVDIDYAIGLKSKQQATGKELGTSAYEIGIGAIYRIPIGDFEPRIRVGYVKHVFDIDSPEPTFDDVAEAGVLPKLSYSAIRLGIGTAINLVDWLALDVSFAYMPVLGVGQLGEKQYGNEVETGAWEAGAGVLARFKETYGARVAIDYRHYKHDFGLANNMDVILPKSGTDTYLRLTASFMWAMPGVKKN